MNEVTLRAFPSNKTEALAMLYVQSQDLTDVTPEELLDKYQDAYKRIQEHGRNRDRASTHQWSF